MDDAGPRALRSNRDLRLLLAARSVSQLGDQLQALALPLLVLALTGSPTAAGLVLGARTIAGLVLGLLAGAVADRLDRKAAMVACDLGRAALTASVPLALALGVLGMPQLVVVALLDGVLGALFAATSSSALPSIVGAPQLPTALAVSSGVSNALRIVGAPVAGAVYGLGRAVPFVLDAVSFVVSAGLTRAIRPRFQERRPATRPGAATLLAEVREGLHWLWGRPVLRVLALLDTGDAFRYGAGYLLILLLATRLHATTPQIGLVFAAAAAGGLLGSAAAPRLGRRVPLGRLAVVLLWVEALAFPWYALAPSWPVLAAVALLESVVVPVYTIALDGYRLRITPDAMRGRASAAVQTLVGGAAALGTAVSGALIAVLGPAGLTWALTGLLVVLAITASASRTVRGARGSCGELGPA